MRFLSLFICILIALTTSALAADAGTFATYFPVLPFDAPDGVEPQVIPVGTNHALDGNHKGITRAILVVHDGERNASAALSVMSSLAGEANATTIIIAPQFLLPSDISRFASRLPNKGQDFATWDMSDWWMGNDSVASSRHKGVSSFTAIDLLLMLLADRETFPDLQTVIVTGTGAGASFVQRYAAFGIANDLLSQQNITLRFLVADASSYLYQTANRPLPGKKGFGVIDTTNCPNFNAYPYGYDKLNPYGTRVGANAAKTNYALRFITYLNAPAADAVPDNTCPALAQGKNDAFRAVDYEDYLKSIYGEVADKTQTFSVIKATKNNMNSLMGSACGMEVLFGDALCPLIVEAPL